jgi:DNA transformation protein
LTIILDKNNSSINAFLTFVVEQMGFVVGLRTEAMFGGYGIYQGDTMFAIIVKDSLYLKADVLTQPDFLAQHLQPFTYVVKNKMMTMSYYQAPDEVFENSEIMQHWVKSAIEVSKRKNK